MEQAISSGKPKHAQVADRIREQLRSGIFTKGMRLLSEAEFAQQFQVNRHTVAAGLRELVAEGLLERGRGRGTIVAKDAAPPLGTSVSNAVGLVSLSEGEVFSDLSRALGKELADRGLYPVLINHQVFHDESAARYFLTALGAEWVRPYGLLADGSRRFPFDYLKQNLAQYRNVVFFHRYQCLERIPGAKYALVDLDAAGRMAARHLLSLGHKRLTCLAWDEREYAGVWSSLQAPMMRGFAAVCREAGVEFSDRIFWELLRGADFAATVGPLLDSPSRPTGVFCYTDSYIADNLLPLLDSRGFGLGRDIDVVGFFNTRQSQDRGFSSIDIRPREIAAAAVRLLAGESGESETMVKPELVAR